MFVKKIVSILLLLTFIFEPAVYAQQANAPVASQSSPVALPAQQSSASSQTPSGLTPQQSEVFQKLSPERQQAVQDVIQQKGMTQEAVEALKARPEFKGLTQEEILKGKELLEKKETEKKQEEKPQPAADEKKVLVKGDETPSLFGRFRHARSYQDIDTNLRPFGYDFFRASAVSVLTERKDIPVPGDYRIGPGDEVRLLLWGRVNAQYSLVVDRDGNITIPQIGPIPVAGMTFAQMEGHLVKQSEQIVGANINVTMGALKSIPVFVLGDVRRPGSYTIGSFATITDALLLAGGPNDIGSMRSIQLKRGDKVVVTYDLYDLFLKGDKSKDAVLQAGDVVFVPVSGPISGIAGNVKRPAVYEFRGRFDLLGLIDLAGGILPTGYTQQIQVERIMRGERQIVIDINDRDLSKSMDFVLQDGDLVKIFSIVDRDVNAVYLEGNVKRPGKYEYKPGMRVRDLLKDADELLPETYLDYGLIKRTAPPLLETSLIPFNLGKAIALYYSENNIELMPQDRIFIFSQWAFKDKPSYSVEGAVRTAGKFPLNENTRLKDALLNAGGATKEAYLKKAELIRVDKQRQYVTLYFDVEKAMDGDVQENILLMDEDRIIIHLMWEEKWKELVYITGEVKKTLTETLTKGMSVSDLIFKAGGITRDAYLEEAELYRTDWKTKLVSVVRFNVSKALERDSLHDIILKDLDRIVVHSIWEKAYKKTVNVYGDVLKPGPYQFTEGMTIGDLVFAAGNILESAYLDEAEVTTQIIENNRIVRLEHKKINLSGALRGDPLHNLKLNPYDSLFVKRLSEWRKEAFASISGEVLFPGRYPLRKGEKLSSLIERAGGYSETAYLKGGIFTRIPIMEIQQKHIDEMANRIEQQALSASLSKAQTALSSEEAAEQKNILEQQKAFVANLRSVKAKGRVSVKFDNLDKLRGTSGDIELMDGDVIAIPQTPSAVSVIGSVYNQSAFLYRPQATMKDYISLAGGMTKDADTSEIYILKSDGTAVGRHQQSNIFNVHWNPKTMRLEGGTHVATMLDPGDTIVVPPQVEKISWLRDLKDVTQVLYQIAVTAGVLLVAR